MMKQVKIFFYVIGLVLVLGVMVLVSGMVLAGVGLAIVKGFGIAINEDMVYHMSGNLGIGVTGILIAIFVKLKSFVNVE